MKKRFVKLALLSAVLFAAAPAFAQSVDDKIKALEQELTQLKDQQVELKKEATAAAAALPTFEYRPGNGLEIEAADKSWGVRFTVETHFRYEFESGRTQQGRSTAELMGRRFRPGVLYCINNCLWEIEATLDLDGFGTGNAKNSLNTTPSSILQRGAVNFHGENLHPILPTVQFGMEVQNAFGSSLARQGSGSVGAQAEYDLVSRNNGFNTGRAGQGIVLNWDDRSLDGIGVPGRIGKFQIGMSSIGEADDGLSSFKQGGKNWNLYGNIQPFASLKNKWISGLTFEAGTWFCNVNGRPQAQVDNGCDTSTIQDHGDGGRQTLITTGPGVGKGWSITPAFGIVYNVGPNTLRFAATQQRWHDDGGTRAQKKTRGWLVGDDLYVWSPKGFLTGSSTTPGSILFGTHFERAELEIGCTGAGALGINPNAAPGSIPCGNSTTTGTLIGGNINQFHRNTVLLREWDLWYVLAPRMNFGVNILWYNATNLGNGINGGVNQGYNLGLCDKVNGGPTTNCRPGKGGDWVDVMVNWRYTF
jgi:hypothetical protein